MCENHTPTRKRHFPEFDSVDGIEGGAFSIAPVGDDTYHLTLEARWDGLPRCGTPRDSIEGLLTALGLPCSQYLEWNHRVVTEDDLDSELGPLDQGTYSLTVELDRDDFAKYYEMVTNSSVVQVNFGYLDWYWHWRDIPLPPHSEYPTMMVFERPYDRYSEATPLTTAKMWRLFKAEYPDTPWDIDLVLGCTSDGHIFIEDTTLARNRYELDPERFIMTTDPKHFFYGYRMQPIKAKQPTYYIVRG